MYVYLYFAAEYLLVAYVIRSSEISRASTR